MNHLRLSSSYHNHLHLRTVIQTIYDRFADILVFYNKKSKLKHCSGDILWFWSIYTYLVILITFSVHLLLCLNLYARARSGVVCNAVSKCFSVSLKICWKEPFKHLPSQSLFCRKSETTLLFFDTSDFLWFLEIWSFEIDISFTVLICIFHLKLFSPNRTTKVS